MSVIAPAGLVMWRAVQLGQSFHLQHSPLFLVLLLFTMLERLTSFASDVAIERDWLTKLVGTYLLACFAADLMRLLAVHAFTSHGLLVSSYWSKPCCRNANMAQGLGHVSNRNCMNEQ